MFDAHYMACQVQKSTQKSVRTYYDLAGHAVFHKILRHGEYYVVDKNTAAVELL